MTYDCDIIDQPGTGTSHLLQPMFDGWAGTASIPLFPGTVYLCADRPVKLPSAHIDLREFEHLHAVGHRRSLQGYWPRLYPISVANCLLAWVFRWSDDDPGNNFLGRVGACDPVRVLEVIAPVSLKRAFGLARVSLQFLAA